MKGVTNGFMCQINNIKAKNSYSIESFYKAIKDKHFSAGVPSLTKYGAASVITFPAIDSQNQVWIMKNDLSTKSHKFSIQKSYEAGLDNIEKIIYPDSENHSSFGFDSIINDNAKKCEHLVDITAKELLKLNL